MIPTITENGAAKKESSFIVTGQEEPETYLTFEFLFIKLPLFQSSTFGSGEMHINFASFIMNRCVLSVFLMERKGASSDGRPPTPAAQTRPRGPTGVTRKEVRQPGREMRCDQGIPGRGKLEVDRSVRS